MSARLSPALARAIARAPEARHAAILQTEGPPEELEARLPAGVLVRQRYRRLPGLAVTATGRQLQDLARMPGVRAIQEDAEVRAKGAPEAETDRPDHPDRGTPA